MRTYRPLIAPLAAGAIALLMSLLFVATGAWSIYDEYTHFDYVVRIAESLDLPMVNDTLGQTALQAAVCGPAPGFGNLASACGADIVDPGLTPYAGASTATSYLPTFYAITGLGAKVLHAVPLGLSWLEAARVMGAVYLAIAAMLVVGISRRLGASSLVAFSAAVLVASMPLALQQFSTVNNDSLAVVLSLAAVYAFLRMRGSSVVVRSLVAFAIAFVALTVKETALIGLIAVAALSIRDVATGDRSQRWWGFARVAASVVIVLAAVATLRSVIYPLVVGSVPDNGLQEAAIVAAQGTPPINLVAGNALQAFPNVFSVTEGVLSGVWFSVAGQTLVLVAIGLPLAALLRITRRRQWRSDRHVLSAVALIGLPLFVIGFLLLTRVSGLPPFFQPRYLLPTAILATAVAASFVRPPWWRLTVPVSLVLATAVAVGLATAPPWAG